MSRSRIRVASLIVLISTILFSSLRSLVSVSNLAVLHLFHLLSEMLSLLASFSSSYVCWLAVFVSVFAAILDAVSVFSNYKNIERCLNDPAAHCWFRMIQGIPLALFGVLLFTITCFQIKWMYAVGTTPSPKYNRAIQHRYLHIFGLVPVVVYYLAGNVAEQTFVAWLPLTRILTDLLLIMVTSLAPVSNIYPEIVVALMQLVFAALNLEYEIVDNSNEIRVSSCIVFIVIDIIHLILCGQTTVGSKSKPKEE